MNIWAPTALILGPAETRKGSGAQPFKGKALARVVAQPLFANAPRQQTAG
ncbi:hypothetical protein V5R04_03890 [Jonesiaceae bacterium BS-20]|uniref:Uncharacterized protein n=1 Tax=Jonesiaceae bacterium BS-20 TaxID=3120821 RepID=A0AAU7DXD4_9MICO